MQDRFFEKVSGLAIIAVLIMGCLRLILPFLGALLWGVIIAISTFPLFERLESAMHGRRRTAALVLSATLIIVLVVPISMLVYSLGEHVTSLSKLVGDLSGISLPPVPSWLIDIPIIGPPIQDIWEEADADMPALLQSLMPTIKNGMTWLLKQSGNLTLSLLEFLFAIVLAGFLCVNAADARQMLDRFIYRIAGSQGFILINVAGQTIRSVSVGVMGTALLQALLSTFGFVLAGVPGAGLLGVFCFILSTMQLGTALVWIPTAFWLGYHDETGWAIFTAVLGIFINISDNIVKPYLISQGNGLPIPLIFLGVLGGLLAWGFIGIFVGATLLVVCFTLLQSWLELDPEASNRSDLYKNM